MSILQILEVTFFAENVRTTAIVVGDVTHTVPLDTILKLPRSCNMSRMVLRYCELREDNPAPALSIFARRNGHLFPFILHYINTGTLVYPNDLQLSKLLVKEFCSYGIIKIKKGYCYQCLMEYFHLHGLKDFGDGDDKSKTPQFQDTLLIRTETVEGEIYSIRAWGSANLLKELFPKRETQNDASFFRMGMSVVVVHTDVCEFLKATTDMICGVIKKKGFKITCFSTWGDECRAITFGQWLLYRDLNWTNQAGKGAGAGAGAGGSGSPNKLKSFINTCCPCGRGRKEEVKGPARQPNQGPVKQPSQGPVKQPSQGPVKQPSQGPSKQPDASREFNDRRK